MGRTELPLGRALGVGRMAERWSLALGVAAAWEAGPRLGEHPEHPEHRVRPERIQDRVGAERAGAREERPEARGRAGPVLAVTRLSQAGPPTPRLLSTRTTRLRTPMTSWSRLPPSTPTGS